MDISIQLFNVSPAIPEELTFLERLASNMWWCWSMEAIDLFRRINPHLWRECGHRPMEFLSRVPQRRLEVLARDDAFLRHQESVRQNFEECVGRHTGPNRPPEQRVGIAYFSLEYGVHESLRIYSGGLGVLAGDHLKAASDMGLPLVAVGLLYRQGYFQQYMNNDGWQQEHYPEIELQNLPLKEVADGGQQLHVSLPLPDGTLKAAVWQLDAGRVPIFLLDANIPENPPAYREITAQLYGGDRQNRLRQELLLGIGGYEAVLKASGEPRVCHMNEGHAAFMSLARIARLRERLDLPLEPVLEIVRRTNIFTTHTPVPAGNETFDIDLARRHLLALEKRTGVPAEQVIRWGQAPNGNPHELSMTVLGLRMSEYANGVSELHGQVARRMWRNLWPNRAEDEFPLRHVTNGIHVASWVSADNVSLYDRYLGPDWRGHPANVAMLNQISQIPDEEFWRAHELSRSRLIRLAREQVEKQLRIRNASRAEISRAKSVLDHDALTIGFARRFATYKRGALLLHDPERFEALLGSEDRPIQVLFAGKAHPADDMGKDLIRRLIHFSRLPNVQRRVVFLEDYDMNIARAMVQGVDVWLNTPRRPQEASGTSGMKAAVNGGLHLSTLDGWWNEGYDQTCGWAIGHGEEYDDHDYQDAVESQALYNLLENEVIPAFYDRQLGDIPAQWVRMMKASVKMAFSFFTSHRMVAEYNSLYYTPALAQFDALTASGAARARELVRQLARIQAAWGKVQVSEPSSDTAASIRHVGDTFTVRCLVELGDLEPADVDVQVYYGRVDSHNRIATSHFENMSLVGRDEQGRHVYEHEITCRHTGRYGYTTRVAPAGTDWQGIMPGFVTWAQHA